MAENRNKNLDKDMNKSTNIGSKGDLDREQRLGKGSTGESRVGSSGNVSGTTDKISGSREGMTGHEGTRTPGEGGFSGSTGNISGSRRDEGESESEGNVEGGLNRDKSSDVERGGRS